MFRLSMVFIPGMLVANLTGTPMMAWLAAFLLSVGISTGLLCFRIRQFRAIIVLSLGFFSGGLLMASHQALSSTQSLNLTCPSPYTGIITEISTTANGHKATVLLLPQHRNGVRQNITPKVTPYQKISLRLKAEQSLLAINCLTPSYKLLAYFTRNGKNSFAEINFAIGDTLIFSKPLQPIPPPKRDFEFNASRYYSSLGIHHRIFLKPGEYKLRPFHGFSWRRSSQKLREIISRKIKERLPDPSSAAIMIAMLIGDKSNINSQLKTSYSKAGSVHILAISGLHIGIVATILIGIIGLPMPQKSKWLAIAKAFTVLLGIWLFTWISGMSPSATRAAFMFTIYLVGILMMRKAQILNILGVAAICLLVREPFLLQNLGFQFSFLALTGIVIWGMPLLRAFSFRYRIVQYAWSIIAISLGAQILVAPAILYYFNEISVISPITSLVAIPSAYVIVFGGIIMLTMEMISPIAGRIIGILLSQGIHLVNRLFTGFSEISLSTINHIYINSIEVALLACLIILASLWLLTGRSVWLNVTIPFSLLFATFHCQTYFHKTKTPHLTIYASKSEFALDVISPTITQTTLHPTSSNYYSLQEARRNRIQNYSDTVQRITSCPNDLNSSIFIISLYTGRSEPYQILYIGKDVTPLTYPTGQFSFIVLAKGLDYQAGRRLKSQFDRTDVPLHDMRTQGAFNLSLL